jgi:hypothetical protein
MTTYGTPPWNRTMVLADYGGHANKRNYGGRGVVDPRTDIDAGQVQRFAADLAAIARPSVFAVVTVDGAATPNVTRAVVGAVETVSAGYVGSAPPDGMPLVTHAGTGHFVLEFEATYSDASGVTAAFAPIAAGASISGAVSTVAVCSASVSTVYVHVYTWNVSSVPALADGLPFTVEVW